MKLKNNCSSDFDVKAIQQRLTLENKFVLDLCRKIPGQYNLVPEEDTGKKEVKTKPGYAFGSEKRATSLEELHKKLQEWKGKKLQYKDKLLKKGVKSKIEKKKRNEERKLKRTLMKVKKDSMKLKQDVKQVSKPVEAVTPVFNSDGHVVFNKFDFAENSAIKPKTKKGKVGKDPRKLLKKLSEQDKKIKQLEEDGNIERASNIKEKQSWMKTFQRAQGIKVRDDPKMLEKALKRKQKQKRKSAENWKRRERGAQRNIEGIQERRTTNINEKIRKKKVTKAKKLVKRGRIIPGY